MNPIPVIIFFIVLYFKSRFILEEQTGGSWINFIPQLILELIFLIKSNKKKYYNSLIKKA